MKKIILFIIVIIFTIALISCDTTNPTPQDTANQTLPPSETTVVEPEIDLSEKVWDSYETWLIKGLKAYENNSTPADMTEFFSATENISYLTLYDHMFEYDNKTSTAIAEALFKFICDTYGPEALFDLDKRVEYKNAYLESLGLPPTYTQDIDIEKFFITVYFTKTSQEYPYHISYENIHYYFKNFNTGYDFECRPFDFHEYMYKNTFAMIEMIETIKKLGLSEYFDTERDYSFYMLFNGDPISYTYFSDGKMYINDLTVSLHEAIHAMGIETGRNIWLSEGICEYFCVGFNFNTMYDTSLIQSFQATLDGYYDYAIEAGDQATIYEKRLAQAYIDAGGILGDSTIIDYRILYDAQSRIDLQYGNENTIGTAYDTLNGSNNKLVGTELTYQQATSMVFYLVDTYGIETVIAAYESDDLDSHFGKTYEELKAEWIDFLN